MEIITADSSAAIMVNLNCMLNVNVVRVTYSHVRHEFFVERLLQEMWTDIMQ